MIWWCYASVVIVASLANPVSGREWTVAAGSKRTRNGVQVASASGRGMQRSGNADAGPEDGEPRFITREEEWEIFDELAHRYMLMSGEAFIRAWKAGEIENPDRPEVMRVAMLLPADEG